jgi:hypothetical protein
MNAYKDILNSQENHIMWFLSGNLEKSQCIRLVVDVAPLPSGCHPTDPNLMYVGIAVKFDGLTNGKSIEEEAKRHIDELLDKLNKRQNNQWKKLTVPPIKLQPQPQKKVEHKREESSRRQIVQCEKRENHFHHTIQLKQPDKCR